MQQHYTNQKPDERLAVASRWKWSRDEDRLGRAEARRHRRSHAGLVSVDHGREECCNQERPWIRDIPCTSEPLLSQATEFVSRYFLEDANLWPLVSSCVDSMCASDTFSPAFLSVGVPKRHTMSWGLVSLSISMAMWQYFYFWPMKNKFPRSIVNNVVWQIVPYLVFKVGDITHYITQSISIFTQFWCCGYFLRQTASANIWFTE